MTPRDVLRAYDPDWRSLDGASVSESPLRIEDGDCVGVVLFAFGGPASLDDVEPFLYRLLMDPAVLDLPMGERLRHWLAKSIAYMQADTLRESYELIGGGSPLTRLVHEQSETLQGHLNDEYGGPAGIDFRVYPAMRYGTPSGEEAASQMVEDGVDKVVLLSSYPQYSTVTTGSAFAYWQALAEAGERPSWPTTAVMEYAANPKYVQAVSERIDEALQRFPQDTQDEVVLVFSAYDTVLRSRGEREDPYCCLVHSTVEQVMRLRGRDRPFRTAFQSMIGPNAWLSPSTPDTLKTLAEQGHRSVLVVPISFVTDHISTSYDLDVEARVEAEGHGIDHFEVTAGLNTHPLLLEALGEATVAQLELPIDVNQVRVGGNGQSQTYPLRPLRRLPRHDLDAASFGCPDCGRATGARRWTLSEQSAEPEAPTGAPANRREEMSPPSSESRSTTEQT
ncbi:MAG: ferrochelatase [Salinibacter sp.]